jgi:Tfp pilus assembly protein PilX
MNNCLEPVNRRSVSPADIPASRGDEGVALVVVLLLTVALSAIGASLLMLAQTDTYTSMNYRMMSQARYGAESGVLKAVNYLTQTYVAPGAGGDPLTNYNTTVSPVTYLNAPVVLSADPAKPSNYPSLTKTAEFSAAAQGTLTSGAVVSYNTYATLVSMREIEEYGATSPRVIQTWQITATGSLGGTRPATVEVSSMLERQVTSAYSFGVFATRVVCGALTFGGNSVHDSYDSSAITYAAGVPVTDLSGSRVGSNGNLSVGGHAMVYGTLSTPRTGVGNCNNGAVNALTETGQADVVGGLVQLPQALTFPTPAAPNPMPPTTNTNWSGNTCSSLGLSAPACTGSADNLTLDASSGTLVFGNVNMNAGATIHLKAGIYNLNSIKLNGNSNLVIDSGPVFMNVAGVGVTTPIDLTGGAILNPTFDPTNFHINYGGTGEVKFNGGSQTAVLVYTPNAEVTVNGGGDVYGAITAATVKDTGGARFHYDRRGQTDFYVAGNYMMSSFTWRKY